VLYRIIQIDLTIVFLHACITILDYIANIGTIVTKMTAVIRKKTSSEAEYNVLHFMKRSMHCELNHIDGHEHLMVTVTVINRRHGQDSY
jgi:hypothetical protein